MATASSLVALLHSEKNRIWLNAWVVIHGMSAIPPFIVDGVAERPSHRLHLWLAHAALRVCAAIGVLEYPAILVALGISVYAGIERGAPTPVPLLVVGLVVLVTPTLLAAPLCRYASRRLIYGEVHQILNGLSRMKIQVGIQRVLDLHEYTPGEVRIGVLQAARPAAPGWYLFRNFRAEDYDHVNFGRLPLDPAERRAYIDENRSVLIQLIASEVDKADAVPLKTQAEADAYCRQLEEEFRGAQGQPSPYHRTLSHLDASAFETEYGWKIAVDWEMLVEEEHRSRIVEARGRHVHVLINRNPGLLTTICLENAAPRGTGNSGADAELQDFLDTVRVADGKESYRLAVTWRAAVTPQ